MKCSSRKLFNKQRLLSQDYITKNCFQGEGGRNYDSQSAKSRKSLEHRKGDQNVENRKDQNTEKAIATTKIRTSKRTSKIRQIGLLMF
jgi:hypothetical protein